MVGEFPASPDLRALAVAEEQVRERVSESSILDVAAIADGEPLGQEALARPAVRYRSGRSTGMPLAAVWTGFVREYLKFEDWRVGALPLGYPIRTTG